MNTFQLHALILMWATVSQWSAAPGALAGARRFALQGNDRLAIVDDHGVVEWTMPWGPIHDIHNLPGDRIMVQQGSHTIVEIDVARKQVIWSYDSSTRHGNAGQPVEVHSFQPLPGGHVMIAESGPARIIEIDRDGNLVDATPLKIEHPHPHTDTHLVRQLPNGHYLVCHEGDGAVREYERTSGKVVWEYRVPLFGRQPLPGHGPESFGNKCFAALRLKNGNTLISTGNGHSVLETTPAGEIVWRLQQRELPGIVLAWVTTLEISPRGNYLIGNCHAGPGQPVLIEVEPRSKRTVWQLDGYERFGNSISNVVGLKTAIQTAP